MNKVIIGGLVITLIIGGWWWTKTTQVNPKTKVTVGFMAPLEGDNSSFGYSILRGVQLAKKELGADNVEIVTENSGCEPEMAKVAVDKLINKGVVAIIGEVCSGASLVALPAINKYKVLMVSAASTSPKLSIAGDYFFRTIPADDLQGKFAAETIYESGKRKLAVVYTNETYGQDFNEVISSNFAQLGGKVVANISVESNAVDLTKQKSLLKKSNPEAVFMVSNSTVTSVAILKMLKELGIKTIYSSEALNDEAALKDAGNLAEGVKITAVTTGSRGFKYAHRTEFGVEAGLYSPQAYDAFYAIYQAISAGTSRGDGLKKTLAKVRFEGKSGKIAFNDKGDVSGNYELLEVKKGKAVPIE